MKIIPVAVLLAGALVSLNYYMLDGVVDSLLALGCNEDTQYSAGYSDAGFRQVTPGMSEAQVVDILGEPLGKREFPSGEKSWWFSKSPGDKSYRMRAIVFKNGTVTEKLHHFYFD